MIERNPDSSTQDNSVTGREARLDEALDESFPASDPVAINIENQDAPKPSTKKSSGS